MRNIKVIIAAVFITACIVGCNSPQDKQINAQESLDKANSDVSKSSQDSAIKAQKDSSEVFFGVKKDWEKQINENEKMIAELKADAAKDKRKGTPDYLHKLDDLEHRNVQLTATIRAYKYNDGDWAQCKRNINNDMNDLTNAIKSVKKS
jgi:hypothetical protein